VSAPSILVGTIVVAATGVSVGAATTGDSVGVAVIVQLRRHPTADPTLQFKNVSKSATHNPQGQNSMASQITFSYASQSEPSASSVFCNIVATQASHPETSDSSAARHVRKLSELDWQSSLID
jgi:hypothetical protein